MEAKTKTLTSQKMKAIVCTKYGEPEVLQLQEVEKPVPKENEVCIKIYATTVSSGDVRIRSFNVPALFWLPFRLHLGILKPKKSIIGGEFAGEIESVGTAVKNYKKGDKVFGSTADGNGCYAEYVCMSANGVLTSKPNNMDFEDAAALFFGGHTALHFLRKANIQLGQKVLIYGASGALGTYAIQLAKYFGAEVTAICSGRNIDLVQSLGADHVIDYTKDDFTKNGISYDVIFDTVGKSPFGGSVKSLSKNGYYLRAVHLYLFSMIRGIWVSLTSNKKVIGGVAHEYQEDIVFLKELVETGQLKPVIDRRYPLEEIVEAHRYVEKGHKKGNVVITVEHDEK
jgi:NADPH:quinone reductase-like Zn-dependent oxidoreductase